MHWWQLDKTTTACERKALVVLDTFKVNEARPISNIETLKAPRSVTNIVSELKKRRQNLQMCLNFREDVRPVGQRVRTSVDQS